MGKIQSKFHCVLRLRRWGTRFAFTMKILNFFVITFAFFYHFRISLKKIQVGGCPKNDVIPASYDLLPKETVLMGKIPSKFHCVLRLRRWGTSFS